MLPILYKKDKTGNYRYWECKVEGDIFYTRYGVLKNRDNHKWLSHQRKARYTSGHGGFRTPEEVALEHANSKWKEKKRNEAMSETLDSLPDSYLVPIAPVLATKYNDLREKHERTQKRIKEGKKPSSKMYTFPNTLYYWEYKFDGERATVSWCKEDVHIFSRSREEIPFLEKQKAIFRKIYTLFGIKNPSIFSWHFDCEIIEPGKCRNGMRSTISRIKEKHKDNDNLVFQVFDLITDPSMPYFKRREILEKMFSKVKTPSVQLVPTIGKAKLGDPVIEEYLALAKKEGYEGIVGKDETFLYPVSNFRLKQIVKYKVENDEEYRIIGATQGIDSHEGLIIFEVEDLQDPRIRFRVTPAFTHTERKNAWDMYSQDPSSFLGKLLTVVYKYKNTYGKPEEARGIRIRDPSDLSVPEEGA